MRLYTIDTVERNHYYKVKFHPEAGITIKLFKNVPCLAFSESSSILRAFGQAGLNRGNHIIPIVLQESTKEKLKSLKNIEDNQKLIGENSEYLKSAYIYKNINNIKIFDATLHKNDKGSFFLKEQPLSQDKDIIVYLELPVSDAQPHYKFHGNTEILLSLHSTYYDISSQKFSQNQLYVAIVKMDHASKVELTYSSPYSDDITLVSLKNLMQYQFEYSCHEGGLYYKNDYAEKFYFKEYQDQEFLNLYSEFSVNI